MPQRLQNSGLLRCDAECKQSPSPGCHLSLGAATECRFVPARPTDDVGLRQVVSDYGEGRLEKPDLEDGSLSHGWHSLRWGAWALREFVPAGQNTRATSYLVQHWPEDAAARDKTLA
jgi:hypothetical protein